MPTTISGDAGVSAVSPGAVLNSSLATDAVTQPKMANSSVGTAELIDGNVTQPKLAALSVATGNLQDDSVTSAKLAENSVGTSEIIDGNVTPAKLSFTPASAGPICSAYANATTSIPASAATKILFGAEEYDVGGIFDPSLSRIQPNVAGYYDINTSVLIGGAASASIAIYVYKNGAQYKELASLITSSSAGIAMGGSCIVQCNGTTDFIEIFAVSSAPVTASPANSIVNWVQSFFIRS